MYTKLQLSKITLFWCKKHMCMGKDYVKIGKWKLWISSDLNCDFLLNEQNWILTQSLGYTSVIASKMVITTSVCIFFLCKTQLVCVSHMQLTAGRFCCGGRDKVGSARPWNWENCFYVWPSFTVSCVSAATGAFHPACCSFRNKSHQYNKTSTNWE